MVFLYIRPMRMFLAFLGLFFMIVSCGETKKKVVVEQKEEGITFNAKKLPNKVKLDPKAVEILEKWPEYQEYNQSLDALYKVRNNEELALALDVIIEAQKQLRKSKYPDVFNKPHIKSRQKVIVNFTLKAKAALEYRTDPLGPVTEMIDAYNAYRNQFTVLVNNTLDTKHILEND